MHSLKINSAKKQTTEDESLWEQKWWESYVLQNVYYFILPVSERIVLLPVIYISEHYDLLPVKEISVNIHNIWPKSFV